MRIQTPEDDFLSADEKHLATSKADNQFSSQSEDVSFFTSLLEQSGQSIIATAATITPNILANASNQLLKSTNLMSKGLRAFGSADEEMSSLSYSTLLSSTVLGTQVLVKGLSKGAQLIEKISNLQ